MSPESTRAERLGFPVAVLAFLACVIATTVAWHVTHLEVTDIGHYRNLAERMLDGAVPYRDLRFEYPPGALLPVVIPGLLSDSYGGYYVGFAIVMLVLGVASLALTDAVLRQLGFSDESRAVRLMVVAVSSAGLGGVILTRFDLFPTVLLLASLLLLLRDRPGPSAAFLGAAIAVKVYPVVLLPIYVNFVRQRSSGRAAWRHAVTAIAIPVLTFGIFVAVSPRGVGDSIWGQISRPLQIESLAAGALLALHQVAATSLDWRSDSGSQNLIGTGAGVAATLSTLVGIAALGTIWLHQLRRHLTPERLVRFSAAAIVTFVAFSKVVSPQYLVWLVFLVPLTPGRPGRVAALLLGAACAATAVWFPARYWDLVKKFDPLGSWLVLLRGLLLVGVLLALLLLRERGREQARSPSLGRPFRT